MPQFLVAIQLPDNYDPSLEDEAMISLNQIEGQMRASSLRKLSDIVGKHPDETLTIMRGWMAQENG